MEAVPRLPMIGFELKISTEGVSFLSKLKPYIASFYHEDPESYTNEIYSLQSLRSAAVRPSIELEGLQMLKRYFCQLNFLKSRFPMEENQACAVYFSWRDVYSKVTCSEADIYFELMNVLYNIGALHTKLGALDSRVTPDGMKMACTHFQCAAWVFETIRETFPQIINLSLAPEVINFMHVTCLAQAQECILEKSMLDNRKAAIIAKVAVQVVDYYKQSLVTLQSGEEIALSELRSCKDWVKYINFKIAYHKAVSLLYQGYQAEEQQKMGERVAFYQAASEQLQEACKRAHGMSNQQELQDSLTFTNDVIEGKKKAAKNENEFIYHEEVPDKDVLQEVKGASLVKGIPFSINDVEVSGPDIFARLVPMEAHESSSLYSEQKAQMLRQIGESIDNKDRALAEFMSSMQLDCLTQMQTANGFTQDLIDRAAAMSAKPTAIQDLVSAMGKLSNTFHDVESMLAEIDAVLKEEETKEQSYQSQMGSRPPSILATDLTREYNKYQEAHSKASDSNQNLHRAMTAHIANLKILSLPLPKLKQQIPAIELPNSEIDESIIAEMKGLIAKVQEMKNQRNMLWNQLRDAVKNDDITSLLVTRLPEVSVEQLFKQELKKHKKQGALIEQNMLAQENILKAIVDVYAKFTPTRRFIQDVLSKRSTTLSALTNSFDTYDDLLAKANKGLEFYNKLETNVSKLLQRIKSTAKVQDEEREQLLAKVNMKKVVLPSSNAPKLKDYLDSRKQDSSGIATDSVNMPIYAKVVSAVVPDSTWPPGVRPAPVGSEMNTDPIPSFPGEHNYSNYQGQVYYNQNQSMRISQPSNTMTTYSNNYNYPYVPDSVHPNKAVNDDLSYRMSNLMPNTQINDDQESLQHPQQVATEQTCGYQPINPPHQQVAPDQSYGYRPSSTTQPQIASDQSYNYQPSNPPQQMVTSEPVYSFQPSATVQAQVQPDTNLYYQQQYASLQQPEIAGTAYSTVNSSLAQPTNAFSSTPVSYLNNASNYAYNPPELQGPSYNQPSTTLYNENIAPAIQYGSLNPTIDVQSNPQMYQQVNSSYIHSNTTPYSHSEVANISNAGAQTSVSYKDPPTQYNQNSGYTNSAPYSGQQGLYQTFSGQNEVYNDPQTYPTGYYQYQAMTSLNYGNYDNAAASTSIASQPPATTSYVNYPSSQNSATTQNISATQNVSNSPQHVVNKEKSNIDLLSGLDFTINQAPLIPQNEAELKKETPKSVEQVITPVTSQATKPEPKPVDLREIERIKRVERQYDRHSLKKPEIAKQFLIEVEKFEKFVDVLTTKTLNGPTTLDVKWKEIQDKQDLEQHKHSISVARCYPMKNRFPDILPYDQTRIKLVSTKDDYINACYVKDLTVNAPTFIVTQSPLQSTFHDFWTMVWEQDIQIIFCLISDDELNQDKYWPKSQENSLSIGNMVISIQSATVREQWTDFTLSINDMQKRSVRSVRLLQYTAWPGSLFPTTLSVINYINEVIKDEKSLDGPLLIHCLAGIGRSGLFCLLISAMVEVMINPKLLPDLQAILHNMTNAKKNIIRDREHLKFAYYAFLAFLKEICANQINTAKPIEDVSTVQSNPINAIIDPLNMLDPLWATKK